MRTKTTRVRVKVDLDIAKSKREEKTICGYHISHCFTSNPTVDVTAALSRLNQWNSSDSGVWETPNDRAGNQSNVSSDRPSQTIKVKYYSSPFRNLTPKTVIQGKYSVHIRMTISSDNLLSICFGDINVKHNNFAPPYLFSVYFPPHKDRYCQGNILSTI